MRHFHLKRAQYFTPTINVDMLWHLMSAEEQKRTTEEDTKNSGVAPVLDLNSRVFNFHFAAVRRGSLTLAFYSAGHLQGAG
jgi:hypothetical protein